MQVTFNPGLTSSRMSNKNCCGGGRKVAFEKGELVITKEALLSGQTSVRLVWANLRSRQDLRTQGVRSVLSETLRSCKDPDDRNVLVASLKLIPA